MQRLWVGYQDFLWRLCRFEFFIYFLFINFKTNFPRDFQKFLWKSRGNFLNF